MEFEERCGGLGWPSASENGGPTVEGAGKVVLVGSLKQRNCD